MIQLVKRSRPKVLSWQLQLDNIIKVLRGTKAFRSCTKSCTGISLLPSVSSFVLCQLLWSFILCDCCGYYGLGCCQNYGRRKELQLSVCHIVYGFMLFCLLWLYVGPVVAVGAWVLAIALMHLYHWHFKSDSSIGPGLTARTCRKTQFNKNPLP